MRRPNRLVVSALACLAMAFAANGVLAQDPPKQPSKRGPRALKIGVVDIGVLFKGYKRKDSLESLINERREAMKTELKAEHERVKDLRLRLDKGGMREGSEPYARAAQDIRLAQFALELKQDRLQANLKKQVEQHTLMILNELTKTIETYGKKYGYDLILKIDKAGAGPEKVGKGDLVAHFQERIFRAQISDVLYFNERTLNVTKNVERVLNSPANLRLMEKQAKERAK
jgi:Skp family chaperone for outer membrane proteins